MSETRDAADTNDGGAGNKDSSKGAAAKRVHPESLVQKLLDLSVGQTESRATRINGEEATASVVRAELSRFHRTCSAAVGRAKGRAAAREYSSAAGEFRTRDGDIVVTMSITRTA